jgi:cobalt/nickel transport system permease protein
MHLPDGFLDTKTLITTAILSSTGVALSWKRIHMDLPPQRMPLLGVTAAFVFAAQMLNFPVAAGTSGHLLGAVLLSVLLGPYAAIMAMSVVLIVQCFMFADGGILALGANIFNMAIIGATTGYALYRFCRRILPGRWGMLPSAAIAAWASIMASSLCCAGELAWSGTTEWQKAFMAMGSVHAVIGIGEAAITCLVLAGIRVSRPDLLAEPEASHKLVGRTSAITLGLVCALGLVLFISPFASEWPDGLESVASRLGFSQKAVLGSGPSQPLAEYSFPGISSPPLATIMAGVLGIATVTVVAFAIARAIRKRT